MPKAQEVSFKRVWGSSLAVQWLRFSTFTAKGTGSIPGQGTDPANLTVQPKKKKNFFFFFNKRVCMLQEADLKTPVSRLDFS